MSSNNIDFLKKCFRWYYFNYQKKIKLPNRFREREFGYKDFNGIMHRHISINTEKEFFALLLKEIPRSIYYSVSFYEYPHLPMDQKNWKGSDLVFDIDLKDLTTTCRNHHDFWFCRDCHAYGPLPAPESCLYCNSKNVQKYEWICEKCIELLKKEAVKLVDMLEMDLGINRKNIKVYFSGNVGFHISVEETIFENLTQKERIEIADYLTLRGIDLNTIKRNFSFFTEVPSLLTKRIRRLYDVIINNKIDSMDEIGVKIDPVVTIDLHRIFRMPYSLHDESGLMKREVNIEDCDPLSESVVFGDEKVEVFVYYSPSIKIMDQTYRPFKRESIVVPLYLAVYLIAKGLAIVKRKY